MDPLHESGSMDPVHESSPWTRSKVGVHGPLVNVLSSPVLTLLQSNNQPTSNRNQNQDQQRISLSKGPVLLLGDSILRGIQQRKFAPNRHVNKQTIAGGTKEMKQYKDNMEEKNDYDYIVIHTGTNDVGNLSTDEIVKNMENCLGKQ